MIEEKTPLTDEELSKMSAEQLKEASERVKEEIRNIEKQLGMRDVERNGQRMDSREYHKWRSAANAAKTHRVNELARIKAWVAKGAELDNLRHRRSLAEVGDETNAVLRSIRDELFKIRIILERQ